ncbi:hypothetical protein NDU88_010140 [Pleurodeles waltl]|uniref:Uncharacterized protein n=1 Tax=Pleurodeles waltl TaxID=8319 RepID=A0AAV7QZF0_PLEWA|nr:hypothetical protein NDU88_010140 [Pleurodeles waltl]
MESYLIQVVDQTAVRVLRLNSCRQTGSYQVLHASVDVRGRAQARLGRSPIPGSACLQPSGPALVAPHRQLRVPASRTARILAAGHISHPRAPPPLHLSTTVDGMDRMSKLPFCLPDGVMKHKLWLPVFMAILLERQVKHGVEFGQ